MKALSIRQPWPYAILNLGKDVENRAWRSLCYYRGEVLVHASKTYDSAGHDWIEAEFDVKLPAPHQLPRGGIVGSVMVHDGTWNNKYGSKWFCGPMGIWMTNPKPLPFFACRGMLGFFDVRRP